MSSSPSTGASDRTRLLRLVAALVIVSIVPVVVLTTVSINEADRAVDREVNARLRTTTQASAEVIRRDMESLAQLVASIADRPALEAALGDGRTATFDHAAVETQLRRLVEARPGVTAAFIADTTCRVTDVVPPSPAVIGADLSYRDWCIGVSETREPYVSEAYRTETAGGALVVAVAVPLRPASRPAGAPATASLVAVYSLGSVQAYADRLARAQGVRLTITDQRGNIVAGPPGLSAGTHIVSARSDDRVRQALAGRSGIVRGSGANAELASFGPVEGIGWTVISEFGQSEATAGIRRLRSTILSVASVVGIVLMASIGVLVVSLHRREAAERLAAEIEDRSRRAYEEEIAAARDAALDASRLKSEFLANMSHEIRTPMNGVLGMTSLLLDTELERDQRSYAETVRSSAEALLDILNDILDFSKIEAGKLDIESIDLELRPLTEEVAEFLALRAHAKDLELLCLLPSDLPPVVKGDPGRIRQVLTNLIGNAVKFTEHGEIVVELTIEERTETSVLTRFSVRDTGIGIARKDQATLFDSFSQADTSTTRRYGGTGLGLAISRQLVELMGGDIGVDSDRGRGSTFWFTLPFEIADARPAPPRARIDGLRVLVVDDNATNRTIVERFVTSWGMEAALTESADGALRALASAREEGRPFDVALLDLHMPEIDGIGLARRLAEQPEARELPLILLTSSGQRGEAERAQAAGMAGYLTKPLRQSTLYDMIATVLGRRDVTPRASDGSGGRRPHAGRVLGRVLVAEDNRVNQRVAQGFLRALGYEVDVVDDGASAIDAVLASSYDVVLMDCQMPGIDGYEATRQIRARQADGTRTPIVALTASAMLADRERCLAAGMDDYVSKPVTIDALEAVLARAARLGAEPEPDSELAGPAPADGASVLDADVIARLRSLGDAAGEDLYGQLAEIYLGELSTRLDRLRDAIAARDPHGVQRAAHALRGSSANIGAAGLAALCGRAEESTTEDAERLLDDIEAEAVRVDAALTALVASTGPT